MRMTQFKKSEQSHQSEQRRTRLGKRLACHVGSYTLESIFEQR